MSKFFNVIANPNNTTATVLMYGDLFEWNETNAEDIVNDLKELEPLYKNIDFRINSNGGDVFSGIAIFNALKSSPANITIYIDGIAASIAAIVALCGKPIKMSKYAQIMLHSVSIGCGGNKDDLKKSLEQVEKLEDTLAEMISAKIGLTKEEVLSTYFDGGEHWITAKEAFNMKLIDAIYDVDEQLIGEPTPTNVYNTFINKYEPKTEKMFEKLRTRPAFANCADDDAILRKVEELEGKAENADVLQAEIAAYKQKEQEAIEAEDTATINEAVQDGRINEAQRPMYTALLKADRTNGLAVINSLQGKKRAVNHLGGINVSSDPWEKKMAEIKENNK